MSRIPFEPSGASFGVEEAIARIQGGCVAFESLIAHYLELYHRPGSIKLPALNAMLGNAARREDTTVLELIDQLLIEKKSLVLERLARGCTAKEFEDWIEQAVRREIGRLRMRRRRARTHADERIDEHETLGRVPETLGEPKSTILFSMLDPDFESAIAKLEGGGSHELMLLHVLARLHVLKAWEYRKLAALVYGPDFDSEARNKQAERIRKWIQPAVRDVRAKRAANRAANPSAKARGGASPNSEPDRPSSCEEGR